MALVLEPTIVDQQAMVARVAVVVLLEHPAQEFIVDVIARIFNFANAVVYFKVLQQIGTVGRFENVRTFAAFEYILMINACKQLTGMSRGAMFLDLVVRGQLVTVDAANKLEQFKGQWFLLVPASLVGVVPVLDHVVHYGKLFRTITAPVLDKVVKSLPLFPFDSGIVKHDQRLVRMLVEEVFLDDLQV